MAKAIIDAEMYSYLDGYGVWKFHFREDIMEATVKVIDARRIFGRLDLLVQTDRGTRTWASSETVTMNEGRERHPRHSDTTP